MFKKILLTILIVVVATLIIGGVGLYFWYQSGGLQKTVIEQLEDKINDKVAINGSDSGDTSPTDLLKEIMGFNGKRTFLLLLLNNTEIRPGGGFIGAYAVAELDNGKPAVLKVEGTEILDNLAPRDFVSVPPAPLKEYLKTKRWEFRDSNWSPDFISSTEKSLELYQKENGLRAGEIDAVIGFTPTVIEEILKITGPITAADQKFEAHNFTEELEYEVEFGYKDKGIPFAERKKLIGQLADVLIKKLRADIIFNWPRYNDLVGEMLAEKQIILYSKNNELQDIFVKKKWAGQVQPAAGDYLMWVDANLGALKTDHALRRDLDYSISPSGTDYIATVTMEYQHQGTFDWRTTRYLSYARLYAPVGAELIGAETRNRNGVEPVPLAEIDQGQELGKQWFGTFFSVEPGQIKKLIFKYKLSDELAASLRQGAYQLYVQKQLGTGSHGLTLDLDFAKDIRVAEPGEPSAGHGDKVYSYVTDLEVDREFKIKLTL